MARTSGREDIYRFKHVTSRGFRSCATKREGDEGGEKEKGEKPEENERMSEVVFTDLATVNKAS